MAERIRLATNALVKILVFFTSVFTSPDYSSARSGLREKSGCERDLRPEFLRILLRSVRRFREGR